MLMLAFLFQQIAKYAFWICKKFARKLMFAAALRKC